jgi:hypothetical protein
MGQVTPYYLSNGTTSGTVNGQGAGRPSSPNFFSQQPFGAQTGWQGAAATMLAQVDAINPFSGNPFLSISNEFADPFTR